MNAFGTVVAIIGVMAAGVIYGTDVFCAIVQRPALTKVDDATVAAVMGWVHQYGDRRLPVPASSESLPLLSLRWPGQSADRQPE